MTGLSDFVSRRGLKVNSRGWWQRVQPERALWHSLTGKSDNERTFTGILASQYVTQTREELTFKGSDLKHLRQVVLNYLGTREGF